MRQPVKPMHRAAEEQQENSGRFSPAAFQPLHIIMPVAVLFGFGTAIGSAILDGFVAAGYTVAIASRTLSKLEAVAGILGVLFPFICIIL